MIWRVFSKLNDSRILQFSVNQRCEIKKVALALLSVTLRDLECFGGRNTVKNHNIALVLLCFGCGVFFNTELAYGMNVVVVHRTAPAEQRALPKVRFVLRGKLHAPLFRGAAARGAGPVLRCGVAPPRLQGAAAGGSPTGGQQDRTFSCCIGSRLPRRKKDSFYCPGFGKSEPGSFQRFCWWYITSLCRVAVQCGGVTVLASDGLKGCGRFAFRNSKCVYMRFLTHKGNMILQNLLPSWF